MLTIETNTRKRRRHSMRFPCYESDLQFGQLPPEPSLHFSNHLWEIKFKRQHKGFINLDALIVERVSTFQGGAVVFLEDVQANRALGHTWLLISCGGSSVWQLKERWKEYIYSYLNLICRTCRKKSSLTWCSLLLPNSKSRSDSTDLTISSFGTPVREPWIAMVTSFPNKVLFPIIWAYLVLTFDFFKIVICRTDGQVGDLVAKQL